MILSPDKLTVLLSFKFRTVQNRKAFPPSAIVTLRPPWPVSGSIKVSKKGWRNCPLFGSGSGLRFCMTLCCNPEIQKVIPLYHWANQGIQFSGICQPFLRQGTFLDIIDFDLKFYTAKVSLLAPSFVIAEAVLFEVAVFLLL